MAIGRGFVRSGSGYVTTPATRAAARAAGTFGAETYAGSEAAAAELTKILTTPQRSSGGLSGGVDVDAAARFRAESDAKRRRVAAAKAAQQKCGAKPTTPPRYFADHNITPTPGHDWICRVDGWVWTMDAAEKVQVDKAIAESDAAPFTNGAGVAPGSGSVTEITTMPPKVPAQGEICPHGSRYSPKGFDKCVVGYHEVWEGWFPTRRRYCDCDKAPPGEEENGEGGEEGFFGDIFGEGAGKISGVVLLVVGGAIVVALLGMFKR